ncbi:hypothetical protein AAU57_02605 [Nonlabens sp. YIK11]|uniref:hypothetical protein n=1 Tax=Nonlabens sp. YIK11 TaxID=1453349 RepID=UPI0006DC1E41|nr:hypothetical protein [Nonlabens sp. YIK11]KQC32342.1 hypothetical protein AAU57_02605 [Nonlabens sp. YIK11]
MSTEGIISIAITLIIGIPSIITFFRINQTKLIHLEKRIINLKDDLLKNFEELSIKYKGIEVQKNIYFINGFIVCQGKKDISNDENSLQINLPTNWKWLDYKIVSNSKGMIFQKKLNDESVFLNFDLIKSKEFVEYEGIIEINEDIKKENIGERLDFHHRIPNVPSIKKFSIDMLKSGFGILIVCAFLAFTPIYLTLEYNDIETYNLEAYNANTNAILPSSIVYLNDDLGQLEKKIAEENSGYNLVFERKNKKFSCGGF